MVSFSFNQFFKHYLASPHMKGSVVLTDVYIHFKRLLLKERNVKIIDFVFETELSLVVRFQTLTHLSCFSGVIVEVHSANCDQSSMCCICNFGQTRNLPQNILVKLSIFNFKIKDVFIDSDLRLICNFTEFRL